MSFATERNIVARAVPVATRAEDVPTRHVEWA